MDSSSIFERPQEVKLHSLENAFWIAREIQKKRSELKALEESFKLIVSDYTQKGIAREGDYAIKENSSRKRVLNQRAFREQYPAVFVEMAEISITKAEGAIGKDNLKDLCTIQEIPRPEVVYIPAFKQQRRS